MDHESERMSDRGHRYARDYLSTDRLLDKLSVKQHLVISPQYANVWRQG